MTNKRKAFITFVVILGIISGFVCGMYVGVNNTVDAQIVRDSGDKKLISQVQGNNTDGASLLEGNGDGSIDFDLYWDVWNTVKEYYVHPEDITDQELFYGSLEGLVNSTNDPYSTFFAPKAAQQFEQDLQGSFEGIGAEIGIKDGRLTIISPLADSPAQKAGVLAGDRVFFINEFDTTGITIDEAVQRIRGPKDSEVTLTVGREGETELIEITIVRGTIDVHSVEWDLIEKDGKKYYHIRLASFNEDTKDELDKALDEILPAQPDGLIVDVRNNPGGFLQVAIDIASLWVENGIIVSEEFSDDRQNSHWARGQAVLQDIPTMVLVNGGSASASEILAGALQDHGEADILGQVTFGKGSVQSLIQLNDGSALKITVAQWLTPEGRQIDKKGVEPDIYVDYTLEDLEADRDPQLERALELIQLSPQQIEAAAQQSKIEHDKENADTQN